MVWGEDGLPESRGDGMGRPISVVLRQSPAKSLLGESLRTFDIAGAAWPQCWGTLRVPEHGEQEQSVPFWDGLIPFSRSYQALLSLRPHAAWTGFAQHPKKR